MLLLKYQKPHFFFFARIKVKERIHENHQRNSARNIIYKKVKSKKCGSDAFIVDSGAMPHISKLEENITNIRYVKK